MRDHLKEHNDTINKFHFIKHSKKVTLNKITFDTNLNSLVNNQKLISALYYAHFNLIGQRPQVKTAQNSIASFKIRPNMIIGTHTTTQNKSYLFKSLLNNLKLSFLPSIHRQAQRDIAPKIKINSLNQQECQITYPLTNLNYLYPFFYLNTINIPLGGANISISSKSKHMHYYSTLHSFYLSTHFLVSPLPSYPF